MPEGGDETAASRPRCKVGVRPVGERSMAWSYVPKSGSLPASRGYPACGRVSDGQRRLTYGITNRVPHGKSGTGAPIRQCLHLAKRKSAPRTGGPFLSQPDPQGSAECIANFESLSPRRHKEDLPVRSPRIPGP